MQDKSSADLKCWWKDITSHLGGVYPFQDRLLKPSLTLDISVIVGARREANIPLRLDRIALAVKSINPYLLGNRTLLEDVSRAPWMSRLSLNGVWDEEPLPQHGDSYPDPDIFTQQLKAALVEETLCYVESAKTIGILLSGGMDSRVVAGIVREIQQNFDGNFHVVGLTWGNETSRDVVYAKQITERYGWEWKHYPLSAERLASNIIHMGKMGAEVSPVHLHAMPEIAITSGLDVVLAGSYGDSVGRAEFSGKHVSQLKSLSAKQKDRFGILRNDVLSCALAGIRSDLVDSPHLKGQLTNIRRCEIEQELHYMRRMLQCCMNTVAFEKRFYQLFTSPKVFGLMWGLSPEVRNNNWYSLLLAKLPGNLLDIPWARTGKRYNSLDGKPDSLSNTYHEYGNWLRNELKTDIVQRVNSDRIRNLGVFNDRGLDYALGAWARGTTITVNSLDEFFSWLASFHDFLEIYQIDGAQQAIDKNSWIDSVRAIKGGLYANVLIAARNKLRR